VHAVRPLDVGAPVLLTFPAKCASSGSGGGLPATGGDPLPFIDIAGVAVLAGAGAIGVSRRRRQQA